MAYTAEVYLIENDDVLAVRLPKECGVFVPYFTELINHVGEYTRYQIVRTCKITSSSHMTDDEKLYADLRIASCSVCGRPSVDIYLGYCPNCGAKVVGE